MYRSEFPEGILDFTSLVEDVLVREFKVDPVSAMQMADSKSRRIWREYRKEREFDIKCRIVPLFKILQDEEMLVKWIDNDSLGISYRKALHYRLRPQYYALVDSLTSREYEQFGCILCEWLGASKILLTEEGNEGGIDFIARFDFDSNAHFLFGQKGPIRIVGQCKKYSTKSQVGDMRDFLTTMEHVRNLSYRPGDLLPSWFRELPGPIIGWHISNQGHQSGALDLAKNYGVLTSNTKELVDLICKLRLPVKANEKTKQEYINNCITRFGE